jgi:RNA polymerase sigma factor (sigma-70 family)
VKIFGNISDEDILKKIQNADQKVVDYLYKKNYRMVVNYIQKNSGTEDEAKDVFQEAVIVFWQKAASGNLVLTSKISTYIFSISQNLWRKELDRKSRNSGEMVDVHESINLDKDEKIKIIHDSLSKLGNTCREILVYYYFEDRSMSDIAEIMGFANADTVKSKKYKCKQELDKYIKDNYRITDVLD